MATGEEVSDVDRGALEGVLQAEGVDGQHGVMEVEVGNQHPVLDGVFALGCPSAVR